MALYHRRKVVSFLVSGRGLIFTAVAEKIIRKEIRARTGCVISDNATAQVLARARHLGVPAYFIDSEHYLTREKYEDAIIQLFEKYKTDLVITAGFLRLLSKHFVSHYRNRIINIHPSLLPSFPGIHSQKKALDYGVKVTGCTAHFIDEGVDTGSIIMQSPIKVEENDTVETLSRRILLEEYSAAIKSVRLFCENKLVIVANKVMILK